MDKRMGVGDKAVDMAIDMAGGHGGGKLRWIRNFKRKEIN